MKTKLLLLLILIILLIMFTNSTTHADKPTLVADLIIINAKVHTMDRNQPAAEAVAIYRNRIAAIGSTKDIKKLAGNSTKVIDAKRQLVLPGFNDAHVHFMGGGFQLASVNLRDANTPQEFAERLRDFAAKLPEGRWITGGDWDHERWPKTELPTKELIDRYTPNTPVFVNRLDGHMSLANSVALKLAGVTRQTLDPPGGVIVRDPKTGEPTGVLKDAAQSFVWKVIPASTFEEKLVAARAATNYAASLGVTSVQDVSAGVDVGVCGQEQLGDFFAATEGRQVQGRVVAVPGQRIDPRAGIDEHANERRVAATGRPLDPPLLVVINQGDAIWRGDMPERFTLEARFDASTLDPKSGVVGIVFGENPGGLQYAGFFSGGRAELGRFVDEGQKPIGTLPSIKKDKLGSFVVTSEIHPEQAEFFVDGKSAGKPRAYKPDDLAGRIGFLVQGGTATISEVRVRY